MKNQPLNQHAIELGLMILNFAAEKKLAYHDLMVALCSAAVATANCMTAESTSEAEADAAVSMINALGQSLRGFANDIDLKNIQGEVN